MNAWHARIVSTLAKKFGVGQWSFIGLGSEKKWYSVEENRPQGIRDHVADKMLLEFAENGVSNFPCNESTVLVKLQQQRTKKS